MTRSRTFRGHIGGALLLCALWGGLVTWCHSAVLATTPPPAAAPDKCTAALTGDPTQTCAAAGNPINVTNGNKYQRETDMEALPGVLGLELVRHYNSAASALVSPNGVLGKGWKLSYEVELTVLGNSLQLVQADGERLIFARSLLNRQLCTTLDPANGSVAIVHTDRGDEYLWRQPSGRQFTFNTRGRLVQIKVLSGEFVSLQHDRMGHLVKVTDPQGRSLELSYLPARDRSSDPEHPRFSGVQHILTPLGRFTYHHGGALPPQTTATAMDVAANLVRVEWPALPGAVAVGRQYLYEDALHPTLLTGVVALGQTQGQPVQQRLSGFAYDSRGWAIRSDHGGRIDVLEMERASPLQGAKPGRSVVVHSKDAAHPDGLALEVFSAQVAGQYRVVETRGAACPLHLACPEANVRHEHDGLGRIRQTVHFAPPALEHAAQGWRIGPLLRPLLMERFEHDGLGRLTRQVQSRDFDHPSAASKGWVPGREHVVKELHYDGDSPRVVLWRTPSVVSGQWHEVQTRFNDAGQPVQVTERGWVPSVAGQAAQRVQRTTGYRHARVNGRSVLVAIDGVLPGEADLTRLEWDARGDHLRRITTPDGVTTKVLAWDPAGRALRFAEDDGNRYSETFLAFERERVVTRTRVAWLRQGAQLEAGSRLQESTRYVHDFQARLQTIVRPDGSEVSHALGPDGQSHRLVLPDGGQVVVTHDAGGASLQAQRYADATHLLQTMRLDLDAQHRLSAVSDDLGGMVQLRYGPDARSETETERPNEVVHADGHRTAFSYDEEGQLRERIEAVGTLDARHTRWQYDALGRVTGMAHGASGHPLSQQALCDDFGRKVAQVDAAHGVMLYLWDEADRRIAEVGESGRVRRFQYDAAGRLRATGVGASWTHTRHDGRLLVEMMTDGGVPAAPGGGQALGRGERKLWQHDSLGRLVREHHWVPVRGASALQFTTSLRYDDRGRLVERTLVDAHSQAHRLSYTWDDGSGHVTSVLYNGEPVVKDVHASWLNGLARCTHGNGVTERFERDARGRLVHHEAQVDGFKVLDDRYAYNLANRLAASTETGETGAWTHQYEHDALGRLVREQTQEKGHDLFSMTYAHDPEGNRRSVTSNGQEQRYAYLDQRLIAVEPTAQQAGWASAYGAMGQPLGRVGLVDQPTSSPVPMVQTVYNHSGKALAAVDEHQRVVARYQWGWQGERLSKTLTTGDGALPTDRTTYYLYQDGRTQPVVTDPRAHGLQLHAEADAQGRIQREYVYLDGLLVACIDAPVQPDGFWRRCHDVVLAWWGQLPDAPGLIRAVHSDQRLAPVAVTDAAGRVIWRARYTAFGLATVEHPKGSEAPHRVRALWAGGTVADKVPPFELNVRLPGQYWDGERGMHDNLQRDYDPRTGRYATPDPITQQAGLALGQVERLAGGNAYGYVHDNPLTTVDPQGLYDEDVHYYMTFFLALAAGVDYHEARIIALAAQYVDNNPETKPFPGLPLADSGQGERLAKYHFTQSGYDPERGVYHPSPEERVVAINAGFPDPGGTTYEDARVYAARRIRHPGYAQETNLQLVNLMAASNKAPTRCGRLQFFGEYLHAFEDTFGHRDKDNEPISVNLGAGHLAYGHEADKTYNENGVVLGKPLYALVSPIYAVINPLYVLGNGDWGVREGRAFEMEKEVFARMADFIKPGAKKVSWSEIERIVKAFNAINENDSQDGRDDKNDSGVKFKQKINILNKALAEEIQVARPDGAKIELSEKIQDGGDGYVVKSVPIDAKRNREKYLCDGGGRRLSQADYPGTILPSALVLCK